MDILNISVDRPSPDLTPSEEGDKDVRQDSPRGQPASTPSGSVGAMLDALSSINAGRPAGQAGASGVRAPRADLAKLARTTDPAGPSQARAGQTAPVAAPLRHADIEAVRTHAQMLSALENRLAALRKSPEPRHGEPIGPVSEADIRKQIDALESQRQVAQHNVSKLTQQCRTAFDAMARHGVALSRKVDLLERYQVQLDKAAPAPIPRAARSSSAKPGPSTPKPAVPDRMAALTREIRSLEGQRRAAAEAALAAVTRNEVNALGAWSPLQLKWAQTKRYIASFFRDSRGPLAPELAASIESWLASWLPEVPRGGQRHRPPMSAEQFSRATKEVFKRIEHAARPEASTDDAMQALARFLGLMSQFEIGNVRQHVNGRVGEQLSAYLIMSHVDHQSESSLWKYVPGFSNLTIEKSFMGHGLALVLVREFEGFVARRQEGDFALQDGDRVVRGATFEREFGKYKLVAEQLRTHQKALATVLTGVQQKFVEELQAVDPRQTRAGAASAPGTSHAPNAAQDYESMIRQLNAERAELARQRPAIAPATPEAPSTSGPGSERERLEIMVNRLRGAVLEYEDKHRETFERHATLSHKQLDASDALEDIERRLADAHRALQGVRENKRRALGESAANREEAASLEREIDAGQRKALEDPALARLISPTALARAMKRHLDQTPAQMRDRVRRDGRTARTGTFRSFAELLRAVAEIGEREFAKPDSALRARTQDEFNAIARHHPGGQISALHSHGRTIGHGVRASDAPDAPPARTGTSQYAIDWAEGEGPRISHMHPWVSPY
jgi:hypothetical protein